MRIELSEIVRDFVRTRPPELRRSLRNALQKLIQEQGDIKPLEKELEGYYRLRVKSYRIIFRYEILRGERTAFCVFAEHRHIVYETFLSMLQQ